MRRGLDGGGHSSPWERVSPIVVLEERSGRDDAQLSAPRLRRHAVSGTRIHVDLAADLAQ
jgi:hypothetical protein